MISLPRKVYLTSLGKHWKVSYRKKSGKLGLIELPYRHITFYGKNYSKSAVITLLNKWVKFKATEFLSAMLIKLNRRIRVNYKKLRIHSLKTEWGSYTSTKILSLNYKVIFLPRALVKYILIHELCHFRHLNHSSRFWNEVAKYDKNWKRHKKALEDAEKHVPEWVIW